MKKNREMLIAYEIKMSSCSDEQAEIKVDSYMASVSSKTELKEKITFKKVSEPMIKWMAENQNPHTMVEIDSTKAILWEGKQTHNNKSFIID